jgi:hypothetical protein
LWRSWFICLLAVTIVALAIAAKRSQYHGLGQTGLYLSKAIKMNESRVDQRGAVYPSPLFSGEWCDLAAYLEEPSAAAGPMPSYRIELRSTPIII